MLAEATRVWSEVGKWKGSREKERERERKRERERERGRIGDGEA